MATFKYAEFDITDPKNVDAKGKNALKIIGGEADLNQLSISYNPTDKNTKAKLAIQYGNEISYEITNWTGLKTLNVSEDLYNIADYISNSIVYDHDYFEANPKQLKATLTGTAYGDTYDLSLEEPSKTDKKGNQFGYTIKAGGGSDNITGSGYSDKITGGTGNNVININTGSYFGEDIINFTKGENLELRFTADTVENPISAFVSGNDVVFKHTNGSVTIKNGAKIDQYSVTVKSAYGIKDTEDVLNTEVILNDIKYSRLVKGTYVDKKNVDDVIVAEGAITYTTGGGNDTATTSETADTININGGGTKTINLVRNESDDVQDLVNLTTTEAEVSINSDVVTDTALVKNDLVIALGDGGEYGSLIIKNLFNMKNKEELYDAINNININGHTVKDTINMLGLDLGSRTTGTIYNDIIFGTNKSDKITTSDSSADGADVIFAGAGNDTITIDGDGKKIFRTEFGIGSDTIIFDDKDATLVLDGVNPVKFNYMRSNRDLTLRTTGEDGNAYDITIKNYWTENNEINGDIASKIFTDEAEEHLLDLGNYLEYNSKVDPEEKAIIGDPTGEKNMILSGSNKAETFISYGADDTILGYGGVDTIYTGAGVDYIDGGAGADKISINGIGAKVISINEGEGGDIVNIEDDVEATQVEADFIFQSAQEENVGIYRGVSGNDLVLKTFDHESEKVIDTASVKNYFTAGGTYETFKESGHTYTEYDVNLTTNAADISANGENVSNIKNLVSGSKGTSVVEFSGKAVNTEDEKQIKTIKYAESFDTYFHGTKGNDSFTLGAGEHELNTFGGEDKITITGETGHVTAESWVPTGEVNATVTIAADNKQTNIGFDRTLNKESGSWSEGGETSSWTSQWQKYGIGGSSVQLNLNFENGEGLSYVKTGNDLAIVNESNTVVLSEQFDTEGFVSESSKWTWKDPETGETEKGSYIGYSDYSKFDLNAVRVNGEVLYNNIKDAGVTVVTQDGKETRGTEFDDTFTYNTTKGGKFVDGAPYHQWEVSGYEMYDSDDTYNVTMNSKSKNVLVADGGGVDTLKFENEKSDLALLFNVRNGEASSVVIEKGDDILVSNSLFVFQKDALTAKNVSTMLSGKPQNIAGSMQIMNWFSDEAASDYSESTYAVMSEQITGDPWTITGDDYKLGAGVIEKASFAGGEVEEEGMSAWIDSVTSNVSAWLEAHDDYADAVAVFTGGDKVDISEVIALYQGGTYTPQNLG